MSLPCIGGFGKRWLLLLPLWLSSACTLITVGNTVKKDFAPALSRGDVPRLVKYSTPELGELFARFTEAEIRQLLRWGATPPPAKSGKPSSKAGSSAPPKITGSLDDFSSSANRARLRVKSGPVKYTFVMHKLQGRWRVHDILIHRPGGEWSFQSILGMFITAKDLLEGARHGRTPPQLLSPELAAALGPFVARLPAWGLLQDRAPEREKEDPDRAPLLTFVDLAFGKVEAAATFRVAGVPVEFQLRPAGKTWVLRDAVVRLPERPELSLLSLFRAVGPSLVTLGDMRYVPGAAPYAFDRVRSLLDAKLAGQLEPVISPLWASAVPLLASRLRAPTPATPETVPPGAPPRPNLRDLLDELLPRLTWKPDHANLQIRLELGTWILTTLWTPAGRLARVTVWTGTHEILPRHLAGFAPFARWWDAIVSGTWSDPATWLHEGVRLLASPWSEIEPLLPRTLSLLPGPLPVSYLRRLVIPGTHLATAGPGDADPVTQSGGRHPPVRLEGFSFTPELITLSISTLGRSWRWSWRLEKDTWRLDTLAPVGGPDLLPYVRLLPPVWRALEGLATRKADLFTAALGPDLQKKLGPGLQELFTTHGKWLETLLRETLGALLLTLTQPSAPAAPKAPDAPADPGLSPTWPALDPVSRTLEFGGRKLAFAPLPDGAWGLLLPEPPPVKSRSTLTDHALSIVELWPTLAGLYLGLATADTAALARFSSPDFTRKVWKKMSSKQLDRLLDRLGVEVPLITGRELVGLLLPGHIPADPGSVTSTAAGLFERLGKLPGVQTRGTVPAPPRPSASAAASPTLRILGTLVRTDRRFPFAEIWLLIDQKRVDLNFSWDPQRRMFVLEEIRVTTKILGRDVVFGLKDSLQTFL